jgi:hypothetical protein
MDGLGDFAGREIAFLGFGQQNRRPSKIHDAKVRITC